MAIVCWGSLAKAANDTAKIEESISEYIEGHNENVNAHQIEGSSLYMHRGDSVLDHQLGSVSLKYLSKDSILGFTLFESLDGWTKYATPTAGIFSAKIETEIGEEGNSCGINAYSWVGGPGFDPTKNPFFQTTVLFDFATTQLAYIVAGHFPVEGVEDCVGFKISNGSLYAYWTKDQVEFTSEIEGITLTNLNVYRVIVNSTDSEIEFYVNGILKYTATANFPADASSSFALFWIQRTGDDARILRVVDWCYEQDR